MEQFVLYSIKCLPISYQMTKEYILDLYKKINSKNSKFTPNIFYKNQKLSDFKKITTENKDNLIEKLLREEENLPQEFKEKIFQ